MSWNKEREQQRKGERQQVEMETEKERERKRREQRRMGWSDVGRKRQERDRRKKSNNTRRRHEDRQEGIRLAGQKYIDTLFSVETLELGLCSAAPLTSRGNLRESYNK